MKPTASYVITTDMARSIGFYNHLFQKPPAHTDSRYSYYDLDGFSFGIFDATHDNDTIIIGNNAVLCFQVADLGTAYTLIKDIAKTIDTAIFETAKVKLFQFTDPDNNRLEIFQEK